MASDREPITVAIPLAAYTGTSQELPLISFPVKTRICAVRLIASTNMTGHTTNNATLTVKRKGTAGTGTTTVASLAFASGTNATAFVPLAITLTTTKANLELAAGEALSWSWVEGGTGIDLVASTLEIDYATGYGGGI